MWKAACLLMLVAGCGAMPMAEVSAGRATIGEVFKRCRQFGLSNDETDVFLIGIASDRDNGFTKSDELQIAIELCNRFPFGSQDGSDCLVCYVSLVDVVYGN